MHKELTNDYGKESTIKKYKMRIATSHIDLHGERLSLEALNSLARQINERYLPINVNHDIRRPIVGRMVHAEVVRLAKHSSRRIPWNHLQVTEEK